MNEMRVLVTGASGFIGSALVDCLATDARFSVVASTREINAPVLGGVEVVNVGEVSASTDWSQALRGIEVVVHTAAVAHGHGVAHAELEQRLRRTNVDGAVCLASQALAAGVRRFVFVSSIGVNGTGEAGQPFAEHSKAAPEAAYAISKLDAEIALHALCAGSTMELVILRPPLVYAGHAPGNFRRLLQLVNSGLPLPFAGVKNRRSLIALVNLVDFIRCCITHPAAANELFLLEEGAPVSTTEIARLLARGMRKTSRMFWLPAPLIALACCVLGQRKAYVQLFESLTIDGTKAQRLLDWQPLVDTEAGLVEAGRTYRQLMADKQGKS